MSWNPPPGHLAGAARREESPLGIFRTTSPASRGSFAWPQSAPSWPQVVSPRQVRPGTPVGLRSAACYGARPAVGATSPKGARPICAPGAPARGAASAPFSSARTRRSTDPSWSFAPPCREQRRSEALTAHAIKHRFVSNMTPRPNPALTCAAPSRMSRSLSPPQFDAAQEDAIAATLRQNLNSDEAGQKLWEQLMAGGAADQLFGRPRAGGDPSPPPMGQVTTRRVSEVLRHPVASQGRRSEASLGRGRCAGLGDGIAIWDDFAEDVEPGSPRRERRASAQLPLSGEGGGFRFRETKAGHDTAAAVAATVASRARARGLRSGSATVSSGRAALRDCTNTTPPLTKQPLSKSTQQLDEILRKVGCPKPDDELPRSRDELPRPKAPTAPAWRRLPEPRPVALPAPQEERPSAREAPAAATEPPAAALEAPAAAREAAAVAREAPVAPAADTAAAREAPEAAAERPEAPRVDVPCEASLLRRLQAEDRGRAREERVVHISVPEGVGEDCKVRVQLNHMVVELAVPGGAKVGEVVACEPPSFAPMTSTVQRELLVNGVMHQRLRFVPIEDGSCRVTCDDGPGGRYQSKLNCFRAMRGRCMGSLLPRIPE